MGQFISPQRVKEEASLHNFITQQPQKCLPIPPKLRPRKRRSLRPLRKRPPPRLQRRSPRQQPRPRRVRVKLSQLQRSPRRRRKSQQRPRPLHPRHKVAWQQLSSRRLFSSQRRTTNHVIQSSSFVFLNEALKLYYLYDIIPSSFFNMFTRDELRFI